MQVDTLRSVLKERPFKPFRLHLTDGMTYDIPHPDFLWIWGSDVLIGTKEKTPEGQGERFHIVDVFLVSRIEPIAVDKISAPKGSNGTA